MHNRCNIKLGYLALALSFIGVLRGYGADILGCPKGIMEGTIWPRVSVQYQDMTEKWNASKGEMVDLDEGVGLKSKEFIQSDIRIGYGLTSRSDIGIELKYAYADTKKKNKAGKEETFSEGSLTELWLAGKYFVIDAASEESLFNYTKVSIGGAFGLGLTDDNEALVAGVSPGCNKAQLGGLIHGGIHHDFIEYAGHVIYEWRGEAAESDGVPGFPFNRSGEDVPDIINYQGVVEKQLGAWFEAKLGLTGWVATQKDDVVLDGDEEQRTYRHNIMAGIQFYPMKDDYEKRKIVLQGAIPYAVKTSAAPDYAVKMIAMWTF